MRRLSDAGSLRWLARGSTGLVWSGLVVPVRQETQRRPESALNRPHSKSEQSRYISSRAHVRATRLTRPEGKAAMGRQFARSSALHARDSSVVT